MTDAPVLGDWKPSGDVIGPNECGYYTAGIDIFKEHNGRVFWHYHAVQFHDYSEEKATLRRNAVLARMLPYNLKVSK